ncbi:MAG: hypothetical protein AAGK09_09400 [Planctomycetota bacterium]
MRRRQRLVGIVVGVAGCLGWIAPEAAAVASASAALEVTVEFGGVPIDGGLIQLVNPTIDTLFDELEDSTGFPSFWTPEAELTSTDTSFDLVVASTSSAVDTGGPLIDVAESGGVTRAAATYGVINPSADLSFLIDVTVRGFFTFSGNVDRDSAEIATNVLSLNLQGDPLPGFDDPTQLTQFASTRDNGISPGADAFSFVSSTTILGFEENYSVLIPPSQQGSLFNVWSIGVFAQAGTSTASAFEDDSNFITIGDDDLGELEILPEIPEPATATLLLAAALGLAGRRTGRGSRVE